MDYNLLQFNKLCVLLNFRNGPSRRASASESTNEQFFLVMNPQNLDGNGDPDNIALAPVSFDVGQNKKTAIRSRRNTFDDGFIQTNRSGRYSMQVSDSRLLQNDRRNMSVSTTNRKLSYISDLQGESDSGISDYGINPISSLYQESLATEMPYRRKSRQVFIEENRRRNSRIKPHMRPSNASRTSQFEMKPRKFSRVYVNNGYESDSIV